MHQELSEREQFCMQYNQRPIKTLVELKNNSTSLNSHEDNAHEDKGRLDDFIWYKGRGRDV
jgi:hypothetical protein